MAWRIAVTSADDVFINQHFGRARWFFIKDLQSSGAGLPVERRDISQVCGSGDHGESVWPEVMAALGDCKALITAKIGPGPRKRLELAGVSVYEQPARIDEALKMLAAYYARTGAG
jgi:predicted Fe-Mo cluster-binding NifX family protein